MSDQAKEGTAVDPAAQVAKDQVVSGADVVDPVAAVERAAVKDQRVDSSILDSLETEKRKAVERYVESQRSKAVNEALKSKTEKGEYMTAEQVEAKMRRMLSEEREVFQAKLRARESFYNHLAENGVVPGTKDYELFESECKSGAYNMEALDRKEVVERIVRAAGIGKFRQANTEQTQSPYLGTSGVPLKQAQEGQTTRSTGDKLLDDAVEMLTKMKPPAR